MITSRHSLTVQLASTDDEGRLGVHCEAVVVAAAAATQLQAAFVTQHVKWRNAHARATK